jgi:hypothetical protein
MKGQQILGTSGAARVLERSEQNVRELADRRVLPSVRDAAGRRLFTMSDVLRVKAELAAKDEPAEAE